MRFMRNFAGKIVERPAVYKVAPQEAAGVSAAVEGFAEALRVCNVPETRTSLAILRKDDLRAEAERMCRPIYLRIKVDPTIGGEDKFSAGVRLPMSPRSRIGAPNSAPLLKLVANLGFAHVITYGNPEHLGTAKPRGAIGIQVFRTLSSRGAGRMGAPATSGDSLSDDSTGAPDYVGTFTRNPIRIPCFQRDDLKLATYVARWITRRGLVGPWSAPVSERVNCTSPSLSIDATREMAA